MILGVQTER